MLTKRTFELIADVLANARGDVSEFSDERRTIDRIAEDFADRLRATNPNFNRERFLRAAGKEG